jgi:hypothetical protein
MRQGRLGVAAVVVACAVAGSAGGSVAADPFSGTWNMTAVAGTPWATGATLTISPGSRSSVPGATGQAAWDMYVKGYCLGGIVGATPPSVSAWYSLNGSWAGAGRMGGCVSDKTNGQLIFFGAGSFGHVQGRNGNQIFGDWTTNPNGSIRFSATLAAGSGGGTAPAAGATKTVPEPAPGGGVSFSSPHPFPTTCRTTASRGSGQAGCSVGVTVSDSSGSLKGSTVVAEGGVTADLIGNLVAECWLLWEPDPEDGPLGPREQLSWCLAMVQGTVAAYLARPKPTHAIRIEAATRAPAATEVATSGCRAVRLAFSARTSGKRIVTVKPVAAKLTAKSVRYSCSSSGGALKIKVDGRVKGGLQASLGAKLDLKLVRPKQASRHAGKVKFAYSW